MGLQAFLLDMHERCHRSLRRCLDHCGELAPEQLDTELDGFGYRTVRLQLHHPIGAERYWVSVLLGAMDASEDENDARSLEAIESFRARVYALTEEYLRATTDEQLATPREVITWGDRRVVLAPMHVIARTQTHLFHHMGQITAMCRLLGHPVPAGMDFPVV
jgi:uncharacterized damage-inducible protein DinB